MNLRICFFLLLIPSLTFAEDFIGATDSGLLTPSAPTLSLTFPTSNGPATFNLIKKDIRSANYRAEVTDSKGTRARKTTVDLYRTAGSGKDFARIAVIRNGTKTPVVHGIFQSSGELYGVTPVEQSDIPLAKSRLRSLKSGSEFVVRRVEDSQELSCADKTTHARRSLIMQPRAGLSGPGTIELATEADHEYVRLSGGVDQANALILSILNGVDEIYRRELGIGIKVTYQHVWDNKVSPLSGSSTSNGLKAFTKMWSTSFQDRVPYDLAHYFKGTSKSRGTVGLAWSGAVCGLRRYSVSERTGSGADFWVPLVAHEMGHNLGALHSKDKANLMYPTLIANLKNFGTESKTQISQNLAKVGECLGTIAQVSGSPRQTVPVKLKANRGNSSTSVRVSWGKIATASLYRVWRSSTSGQKGSVVGLSLKNYYVDKTGTSGTHYWYSVSAVSGPDESPESAQVEGWKK